MEICNAMHRPQEHVTQYMMAELGTTGTLDGQQRLIIKEISAESVRRCFETLLYRLRDLQHVQEFGHAVSERGDDEVKLL